MSASIEFRKAYTKRNLRGLYFSLVRYKTTIGLDRINKKTFENNINENINVIYRKIRKGTYKFTAYREKLILRGPQKLPRLVSIPTIRDKLTLRALFEVLHNVYGGQASFLHQIINEISITLKETLFDGILRLDVKDFYPSIDHAVLCKQIKKSIKKKEILECILKAIKNPTANKLESGNKRENSIGVPQGLSISNILANIYFFPIDNIFSKKSHIKYFRYVDDILILCKCENLDKIRT
jgi:retron-type reverse transcriptase